MTDDFQELLADLTGRFQPATPLAAAAVRQLARGRRRTRTVLQLERAVAQRKFGERELRLLLRAAVIGDRNGQLLRRLIPAAASHGLPRPDRR